MSLRIVASSVSALLFVVQNVLAIEVDAGYHVYPAAEAMVKLASRSWEWGTAAEALLELYNPELTVFGADPFPDGKVPKADPSTFALAYAKQFIYVDGQVLVPNSAVGDPASLGVSAILLGQSDEDYLKASDRQGDYILNQAPRWSNGAISHRPDVAEIWADNMAMSPPFLAYLAVQKGDASLMAEAANQCGLHRAVLKRTKFLNWQHIIGPQSQDTGLWSTGNGWAGYGMVRVLHTLQKWPGSSSMTSESSQLKDWIQEILDGAMLSGVDGGLLHNYMNDDGWFGEVSGTALLSAVAYRMAVNDPGRFSQRYVTWADANREALARDQGGSGLFRPAVNPYNWLDRAKYTSGSPEGQAFAVYLYTAYRDCVGAGVCTPPVASATTISRDGIGPIDILTVLNAPLSFFAMPSPTGTACGSPQSCDDNGCKGSFPGLVTFPVCQAGPLAGCRCTKTATTCGPRQGCDLNRCDGAFSLSDGKAYCTHNFRGCECAATAKTCGPRQNCGINDCAGAFLGSKRYAQCTGFFKGCDCEATSDTCGPPQSCGLRGCTGAFSLSDGKAYCTRNFMGCECKANPGTCGAPQSCDKNHCAGSFVGNVPVPQCTGFFAGCQCSATSGTCGTQQSCDLNGCSGGFDVNGKARCQGNFQGCACYATPNTCGTPQDCDLGGCNGSFDGSSNTARCRANFSGCVCKPVASTCGNKQSCSLNGCNGSFNEQGTAVCVGNFYGCPCIPDPIWIPPPPPTSPPPPPPPSLPPLQHPWYCIGLSEEDDCGFGGCTRRYELAARNMDAGTQESGYLTGLGHSVADLCGATLGGAAVLCQGDITAECADYGVALYNSRSCRSYCPGQGDPVFCWNIFNGDFASSLSMVLVCDRALE